jgi:cytosine/adenosine deaminase-related metal-dependent hydrolase
MTRTLTARWVLPAAGPPLEGGLVTLRDDKIEAVDPHGSRTADDDLGNVAIIPSLVNPHTHLDLSGARGLIPPTDPDHFTDWLKGVIAYRKTRTPEQVQEDIRAGLAECMKFGTTLIGDIANGGASWRTLAEISCRAVVFFELIGLSDSKVTAEIDRFMEWRESIGPQSQTGRRGISPHAPYSVQFGLLTSSALLGWPVSIHLAEPVFEMDLLENKAGPLVTFLDELGVWNPDAQFVDWTTIIRMSSEESNPFRGAANYTPLQRVLLIHANYLPPNTPFGSNQAVVYCPRTHAAFGHPPHPFREFLASGVRVCLGTDSLASNPDLDILAEARFVHAKYPDFPGEQLLKMVTLAGAEALGWADECGSLEQGKSADLVAVPLPGREGDPYELLFSGDRWDLPRRTMFRGEWRL